ncbi:MAG: histidinol-phosphate transaminase [Akkermansia sp.]
MNDLDRLVRPNIAALTPYSTARDEYTGSLGTFLDANESPYDSGFNRYPDPHQKQLKAQIAALKGIAPQNLFLGNGSDEAIDLLFRVFCEPGRDEAVAITPSYGMYSVAAAINNVVLREVPLGPEFSLPTEALLAACSEQRCKLLFLCSPNNPTGNAFPRAELLRLAESFAGITVVDEAYIDFSSEPGLRDALPEHPRLVILQTLSKAWGMAGLRLGLAMADARIIRLMSMVKYPYNINEAALRTVSELLRRPIGEQVREILRERARVAAALPALRCVERVYPSDANFLLVRVTDADGVYEHLVRAGIIVRNRNRVCQCAGCLRLTIGLPEENDRLLTALADYAC